MEIFHRHPKNNALKKHRAASDDSCLNSHYSLFIWNRSDDNPQQLARLVLADEGLATSLICFTGVPRGATRLIIDILPATMLPSPTDISVVMNAGVISELMGCQKWLTFL